MSVTQIKLLTSEEDEEKHLRISRDPSGLYAWKTCTDASYPHIGAVIHS